MLTLPCVRSASDEGGPAHTLGSCEGEPVLSENISSLANNYYLAMSHATIEHKKVVYE